MDTLCAAIFLVFGLGFFIHSIAWADSMQRRDRLHTDKRDDIAYHRMLQERREFGYDRVEEAIKSRPFFRSYKFK